ncbi:ATP-binding protein [Microlunatus antarcticus]|uniref:Class 3 adenylate cyclase/tetratricopeptide (TPR) repeat protein n=1 Tax=Microlunatus antarcticus TaxID=53388 RepID=A0A7W5JXA2_9ACTN|nr:adenylate/guanylate cyclase domain-containing protein [Microlunatus antarcticus]MBB3327791.1 class 3 adenylate cyclase/tetratricopeptide (TPR) repeat protein [Microlunatus antarcticus]
MPGAEDRFCASCGRPLEAGTASPHEGPPVELLADPTDGADGPDALVELLRGFVGRQVADRITLEGGRPEEERRLVTAVFADLSGFAALAGRLDAEELQSVVDPVLAGLAGVVGRYDGHVEKFAGDALLALFGAPVAHEDDAARALHAALDMRAELTRLVGLVPTGSADELRLHVGVSTGPVVARTVGWTARMDYAVLGESVILAQRLQALAPAGEVYVGASTRALVGEEFVFADLGSLTVKDRPVPVAAFRLLGRGTAGTEEGLPLVGREAEQAALTDCLGRARAGEGVVVRVSGPPGSGKSRLLAEVGRAARVGGATVVELLGAVHAQSPYRCVLPLVASALQHRYPDAEDRLDALAADDAAPADVGLTAVLVGRAGAGDALDPRSPDLVRRQLDAAVRAWLLDLVTRGPVVLLADGLQSFDTASAEVLGQLVDDPVAGVLLCLGTRDEDGPRTGTSLRLPELGAGDVRELVAAELGLVPDDRLVAHVSERGQGNPLMVRETVRQLRLERLLEERHGFARLVTGAHTVPATLEGLLAARLDALPPAVAQVATTAAVIGLTVPPALLREVTGLSPESCARQVDALVRADVLRAAPADGVSGTVAVWRFENALVRDLLVARLTTRRRQRLHARVADALGAVDEPSEEVVALRAEHLYLAGDLAGALPWLRRAAVHARRLLAQDSAVLALTRAVQAARSVAPEALAELATDLADVWAERGEHARARELYREARRRGGDARSWAGEASVLRREGRYADALALLDEADAARAGGDVRLLANERSWALSVSGDLEGAVGALQVGLDAGDPTDGVAGLLLLQLVRAETLLGQLPSAREHVRRAIDNLERAGDRAGLCTAFRLLGSLQQTSGELDAAATTLIEGLRLATQAGLMEEMGGCQLNLGLVHADRGDHRAAEDAYRLAGITFEQAGIEAGRAMAYGNRACELFLLGEHDRSRTLARRALALAEQVGNQLTAADVHQTLALVAEATGDLVTAHREAEAAVAGFERAGLAVAAGPSRELAERCAP